MSPNESSHPDTMAQPAAAGATAETQPAGDRKPAPAKSTTDPFLDQLQGTVARKQAELKDAQRKLEDRKKVIREREKAEEAKLATGIGKIWLKLGLSAADAEAMLKTFAGRKEPDRIRAALGIPTNGGGAS